MKTCLISYAVNYRAADQHLCFLYIDSTIPLPPKSKSSHLLWIVNPEDRFCRDEVDFPEMIY